MHDSVNLVRLLGLQGLGFAWAPDTLNFNKDGVLGKNQDPKHILQSTQGTSGAPWHHGGWRARKGGGCSGLDLR